ncbi:MAG: hypothetical protein WC505_07525 [Patescibacteria group bacterium]
MSLVMELINEAQEKELDDLRQKLTQEHEAALKGMVPLPNCTCGSQQVGVTHWRDDRDPANRIYFWAYRCLDCGKGVDADTLEEALAKWVKP